MTEIIKYGLLESDIMDVISILQKNRKIEEIILFGSRAKGNFNTGSDIDIAIKGEDLKLNDLLDASIEIDELFLPYKFDLVIYNRIKEKALVDHINRIGKVLFRRE